MALPRSISVLSPPATIDAAAVASAHGVQRAHDQPHPATQPIHHGTITPAFITVFIADDHRIVREGIRFALHSYPDLRVVGEACSGEEAVQFVPIVQPQVVLMDLLMPGMGGLAAMRALHHQAPNCKFLVLTAVEQGDVVRAALHSGAHGYHVKTSGLDELVSAIRSVVNDQPSPNGKRMLLQPAVPPLALFEPLTAREREVLQLLAQGLPNKTIAETLVVTVPTVKAHVNRIRKKLRATNRTHVVSLALQHHLVVNT